MDSLTFWDDLNHPVLVYDGAAYILQRTALLDKEVMSNIAIVRKSGRCLLNAVEFLCDKDALKTLTALSTLLETLLTLLGERSKKLKVFDIEVVVNNVGDFTYIVLIATQCLVGSIRIDRNHDCFTALFVLLHKFIDINAPYLMVVTGIMHTLLDTYILPVDIKPIHSNIMILTSEFMASSGCDKSVKDLKNMLRIVVRSWSNKHRIALLVRLLDLYVWNNYACYLVQLVIEAIDNQTLKEYAVFLTKRLSIMLKQKNLSSSAIAILKQVIQKTILTDMLELLPILLSNIPKKKEERSSFTKSILTECINILVNHYKLPLFEAITQVFPRNTWIHKTINILALLQCVKQNFITGTSAFNKIIVLYTATLHSFLNHYVVQIACNVKDLSEQNLDVQLKIVIAYLENIMHLPEPGEYCLKDLQKLASYINVICNLSSTTSTRLKIYSEFVKNLHFYCMVHLKSRCPDRIEIAAEIYEMIEKVFLFNPFELSKTSQDQGAYLSTNAVLFNFMFENKEWFFSHRVAYKELYAEFHQSKKVYPKICKLILKCSHHVTDEEQKESFQLGFEILLTKYNFESVAKGCAYVKFAGPTNCAKYAYFVNAEWQGQLNKLRQTEEPFKYLIENPVYGLTACIQQLLKDDHLDADNVFAPCEEAIKLLLKLSSDNDFYTLNPCLSKSVEFTIMALLDILLLSSKKLKSVSKLVLTCAKSIIDYGNMKKLVVAAADAIMTVCSADDDELISWFQNVVLDSLYTGPQENRSIMRRHPRIRLIIHAIVVGSQKTTKPLLNQTMNSLLNVLSNTDDQATASALDAIEMIVADSSLRASLTPFIATITTKCLIQISKENWSVKNAAIQVFQALVNKMLGQKTNSPYRRNALEDVKVLYPEVLECFDEYLGSTKIEDIDSIVSVLSFLSEAAPQLDICSATANNVSKGFYDKLLDIIMWRNDCVGVYAGKAAASMCAHSDIPHQIRAIVDWIKEHFATVHVNIFNNCYVFLAELMKKYYLFREVRYFETGEAIIKASSQEFVTFLSIFNSLYERSLFAMLGIKTLSVNEVVRSLPDHVNGATAESRLWLKNNVLYALTNVTIGNFCSLFELCLYCEVADTLKDTFSVVYRRYNELVENGLTEQVLNFILNRLFNSPDLLPTIYYCCYLIPVLCNSCQPSIRLDDYNLQDTENLLFMGVYAVMFAYSNNLTRQHHDIIENTMWKFRKAVSSENEDQECFVASTLKYLYKIVNQFDRGQVLQLAFMLLYNRNTSVQITKFIASVFDLEAPLSIGQSLDVLLSYDNLLIQLGTCFCVVSFYKDMGINLMMLKDGFYDSGGFYLKQRGYRNFNKQFLLPNFIRNISEAMLLVDDADFYHTLSQIEYLTKKASNNF